MNYLDTDMSVKLATPKWYTPYIIGHPMIRLGEFCMTHGIAIESEYSTYPDVTTFYFRRYSMLGKDKKKVSQQALSKARLEVGSVKRRDRNIVITDNEWEAIQAGAVSETILKRILNNSDPDSLRAKAMPKESSALSDAKIARIKAMSASYTIAQIADKLGYSTSTISKALKGGN